MKHFAILLATILLGLWVSTSLVHAAPASFTGFTPLAPLPQTTDSSGKISIVTYLPGIIKLAIGVAGVLAVLYIVVGGIKYMTTDAFATKGDAKTTIQNAVFGLLLAIGSYVILNTLNPDFVNFDLSLEQQSSHSIPINNPNSSTTPYLNPDSASLQGCVDCARIPSNINHKNAPDGCKNPGPCVINKEVGQKLSALADALDAEGINYQVTEMYPPTRQHQATCQQVGKSDSGTCVDVALRGNLTLANINKFCQLGRAAGLNPQYEVPTADRRTELLRSGAPTCRLVYVQGITGEHFSVYNQ